MTSYWEKTQDKLNPNVNLAPLTATVDERDRFHIGGHDVHDLVEEHGSPLYIADEKTVRQSCRAYQSALAAHYRGQSRLFYASKAHCSLAMVSLLAGCGAGIDVVSDGELTTCMRANVAGDDIIFHGNNKSYAEVRMAVAHGATLVLDNWRELELIERAAAALATKAKVYVRLTPGIECHTHEYVQTGHLDSKFGFDPDQVDELLTRLLAASDAVELTGLHAHIGSQIFELQPHRDLAAFMVDALLAARRRGFATLRDLNMGGGLGVRYTAEDDPPTIDAWVRAVCESVLAELEKHGVGGNGDGIDATLPRLICEPGRSIVATSCVTAYRVGGAKSVPGVREYVSVDGGMSDNPRPITYGSRYTALLASTASADASADTREVRVTGKHCEEGDILLRQVELPALAPGDVLVTLCSGAYHMSMASNYNRVCRPAMLLVAEDGGVDVVQRRETFDDLLQRDSVPTRLQRPQIV